MRKMNKKAKNFKCQVFTPENYVKELLDSVDYNQNILNKTVLENSCGDGNILIEIVKRYIKESVRLNYSNKEIVAGLSKNIYGFEIDKKQYDKCIYNLNNVAYENGIQNVEWKIYNKDYLKSEIDIEFDFIIGNPPYITYSELSLKEREFIKENYNTCKCGKFDYCYAFIEHSIKSLSEEGKMSYLIPSSIFKTVFGNRLREYIKPYIYQIKDYTKEKIFDDVLIKSAIIVVDKKLNEKTFSYLDMSRNNKISIFKNRMQDKWIFSNKFNKGNQRFGDHFKVSHVIATLLNEAYVIKEENYNELNDYYQVKGINIEKEVVKDTATPRTKRYKKLEKIIFPYAYVNDKLLKFAEKDFRRLYPGAFKYLNEFRAQLEKRKSDNNAKWFEYGRTQALLDINCEKLLISTIVTEKIFVYNLEKECIPYAGMYISLKKKNKKYNLDYAKKILESEEFMNYVKKVGINISGSSLRITSKDIENFKF